MIGTVVRNGKRWSVLHLTKHPIETTRIAFRYTRDSITRIDYFKETDILTIRNHDGQPIGRGYLIGGELVCDWNADERIELFS